MSPADQATGPGPTLTLNGYAQMSARNKYIVAAVAAVAILGGGAAVAYYSNTRTAPQPLVTQQAEEVTGVDLAELDATLEAEAATAETIVDAAGETVILDESVVVEEPIESDVAVDAQSAQPEALPAEVQPE